MQEAKLQEQVKKIDTAAAMQQQIRDAELDSPNPPVREYQRGRGGHRGYQNTQRGYHNANRGGNRQQSRLVVPKTDYDFESANAKFSRDDASVSAEQEVQPAFYQKTSFFDSISSDITDRFNNRDKPHVPVRTRQEERKLNVETFGQANVRGGYRGRGRGGRGRGRGYRGGQSNQRDNQN